MSRRSLAGAITLVALLLLTLGTTIVLLLRYEPPHHRAADVAPSEKRTKQSQECMTEFMDLVENVQTKEDDKWNREFTDEQINSFLTEGLEKGVSEQFFPAGISEPRVTFEPDIMRLSFRYRARIINTVVSVKLRPWVVRGEGNVLAIAIEGLQAGIVPFKAQWLLEHISEGARRHDIDVSWYRHQGNPVAILRFQATQARPTIRLNNVVIEQGKLKIHGESTEKPRTAMLNFRLEDLQMVVSD